ncbi:MAG: hypothetical protein CSA64_00365 [Arachnia propionica]|nr:MAG: hypothetical protein CSA64_00365 [Arachnia propionica]
MRPPQLPLAYGLVVASLETLAGRRPLHQIRRHCDWQAFARIAEIRESGQFLGSRIGGIRLQQPLPNVVEATARIALGRRWLACAIRLEAKQRWHCASFELLGP